MTLQITIIGLGQIGTSLGLALAGYQKDLYRVGHDKNLANAKKAQTLGAVDKVHRNLPNSVKDADMIILSLPFSEIHDTLKYISDVVKEDAIILDTGPSKAAVHAWVDELLPTGRTYVGLGPVINAEYLYEKELGINTARKDLFEHTPMLLAVPAASDGDAVDSALTLIGMLGSQAIFTDLAEADAIMSSAHLLPQLTAAALLNTAVDSSGWQETRKFAGRAFAEATRPSLHQEGAASLAQAAFANREGLTLKLDALIASLEEIKSLLSEDDGAALEERLFDAQEGRLTWDQERYDARWLQGDEDRKYLEMPSMLANLFGYRERKRNQ